MKTIKRIILLVALTLAAYAAHAQSGYYHQVGDTVRGKSPIYHYEHGWWPTLNAAGHTDSLINTVFSTFGYMKHTTNTPLKVIGVASTWARLDKSDPSNIHEDLDANIEGPMYYVLCDATASGLVELTRVCWTDDYMTHPKRYMELPLKTGFCSNMEDHDTIVSLREYYFDSAITVTDSFYLGCVTSDPIITDFDGFYYMAFHMWNYCTYSSMEDDGTYKDCATDMPEFTYYDSSRLDNQWHYYTHKRFQLVFPIIEVDTFCVTPGEPYVASRDSLMMVRVEWTDNSNLSWEVSRTAPGGDPNTGLITPTTNPYIEYTDIDNDSAYHVYVRGYCETGIWSGWSDWSTPCLIDSIPTPPTPPDPPAGITTIETADFTLSPNPAKSLVTLKCTGDMQGSVEIIDMQGKVWSKKVLAGHLTEFDVSALPAGAYLVRITTDKGTTTKKLSIE